MTPEEHNMLQEALDNSRENSKLLKKMHRVMVVGRVLRFFYWIIVIGAAIGAFYLIQPYIDSVYNTVDTVKTNINTLNEQVENTKNLINI